MKGKKSGLYTSEYGNLSCTNRIISKGNNWKKWLSMSIILKQFLSFGQSGPSDSYNEFLKVRIFHSNRHYTSNKQYHGLLNTHWVGHDNTSLMCLNLSFFVCLSVDRRGRVNPLTGCKNRKDIWNIRSSRFFVNKIVKIVH